MNTPGAGSYLGVRSRWLAELNEVLRAGVTVSSDGNFGRNVSVQLGATFGGRPTRTRSETPAASVQARLGQPVQRQETIALDQQQEDSIDQALGVIAINPATGQPWQFLHVTGGLTGGSGRFEEPFGQVTAAVAEAQTTGNQVIYVEAGTNPGLDGFTIPDQVRVLSTGVPQFLGLAVASPLGGSEVFTVQLPGSGTGQLPRLNGASVTADIFTGRVAMGNNTVLSGFELQTTGNDERGILAVNVSGATLDRNRISTAGDGAHGISAHARNGTLANTTITGNTITTTGTNAEGMYLHAANNGTLRNVTITGNTVSTTAFIAEGIFLRADSGSELSEALVAGNQVTTAGDAARGIFVSTENSHLRDVTIRANTVVTTGNFNGVFGDASGIFVRSNANGDLRNVTVVENTVFTSGDQAQAMHLFSNGGGSLSQVALLGNRIQQAGQHSVLVRTNNAAGRLCIAQFRDNISLSPGVFNPGANDLRFEVFGGSTVNFVDFAKVAVTNTSFGSISGSPTGQPGACP